MGLLAILCFVFSYLQFNEKGFLFNNAYIYASWHYLADQRSRYGIADGVAVICVYCDCRDNGGICDYIISYY